MKPTRLLILAAMLIAAGALGQGVTSQTVTIPPAQAYAAFIVPDPGATLTLTINAASSNELVESAVVPSDTGDMDLWKPSNISRVGPHVYTSGTVLSSREWLRIHGKYKPTGGTGGGGGTLPEFDVDVPGVDVDIEGLEKPEDEKDEEAKGGFVCVGCKRRKLIIRKVQSEQVFNSGTVTVTATGIGSGTGQKLKVWDAQTGGNEVNFSQPQGFAVSSLPKELWIEGLVASSSARDIEFKAAYTTPRESKTTEDKVKLTVIKVQLIKAGFDAVTASDEIALKQDSETTDWNTDPYVSNGQITVSDPVWEDSNFDGTTEKNMPVCFKKGAIPKIAGNGKTKIKIEPDITCFAVTFKIKVLATPDVTANSLLFGPKDLSVSGTTVDVPEITESTGQIGQTPSSKVASIKYAVVWKVSADSGSSWCDFANCNQVVFITSDTPKTDYCSNLDIYTYSSMAVTSRRMDWACKRGKDGIDASDLPSKLQGEIDLDPGFQLDNAYHPNPFSHLDSKKKGDCISLANLAATALRLLGINGCVRRAYCVMLNTVDPVVSSTWGWEIRIHKYHSNWGLAWQDNNFEGFYYVGEKDPLQSGSFPTTAWTIGGAEYSKTISTQPGKEKYLPVQVLQDIGVTNLRWRDGSTEQEDLEWKPTIPAISGVVVGTGLPCTTWTTNPSNDGEYPITFDKTAITLKLNDGTPKRITGSGFFRLSSTSPQGEISVDVDQPFLPNTDTTSKVRIVPARTLDSIP
jgi:hypothetical protein